MLCERDSGAELRSTELVFCSGTESSVIVGAADGSAVAVSKSIRSLFNEHT